MLVPVAAFTTDCIKTLRYLEDNIMDYIRINENELHIVFGITDKNQIKLLHFSKAEFCEDDLCKFGPE